MEEIIDFSIYGKIVCAAVLHNNCIYFTYGGHHTIFPMEPIGVLRNSQQGFITENGYFVDRIIGLKIAQYFEQLDYKYPPLWSLNSEDLKKLDLEVLSYRDEYSYKMKRYYYN